MSDDTRCRPLLFRLSVLVIGFTLIFSILSIDVTPRINIETSYLNDGAIPFFVDDAPSVTKVGTGIKSATPYDGYTLFAPGADTTTYLINISGDVVHTWPSTHTPGLCVYMKDNGNIVRTADLDVHVTAGGGIQEIAWNGTLLWDFHYYGDDYAPHHDIALMPNGNVLILVWENKTAAEAIAEGRDPSLILPIGIVQTEYIIEVKPTGPTTGEIVWEWHVWDHLIQDFDPTKNNYGVVEDHPELMDINYPNAARVDWLHGNGLDYNPELDQISLSCRVINEFWIIDHNTTTAEAAGHTGGHNGKGGDLIYRWGNPIVYRAGTVNDQQLFGQHDASWIEPGSPGEGNILVFNNGGNRPTDLYSTVDEIVPPVDADGYYSLIPGTAYEPAASIWNYTADPPTDFFAFATSGAQRQPNGNTLICHGPNGYFFEVTPAGDKIWEYQNTFPAPLNKRVFKIRRYTTIGYDIALSEGWNLISLPLTQTDESLDNVLKDIDGKWDCIQVYNTTEPDHWKTNATFKPDLLNDLNTMDHKTGFWINIIEPGVTFTVIGRIPPSDFITVPLFAGWNLVGFPSLSPALISDTLAGTGYDHVEGFNASMPYRLSSLSDSYLMKPGEGYWIHVPVDTIWTIDW